MHSEEFAPPPPCNLVIKEKPASLCCEAPEMLCGQLSRGEHVLLTFTLALNSACIIHLWPQWHFKHWVFFVSSSMSVSSCNQHSNSCAESVMTMKLTFKTLKFLAVTWFCGMKQCDLLERLCWPLREEAMNASVLSPAFNNATWSRSLAFLTTLPSILFCALPSEAIFNAQKAEQTTRQHCQQEQTVYSRFALSLELRKHCPLWLLRSRSDSRSLLQLLSTLLQRLLHSRSKHGEDDCWERFMPECLWWSWVERKLHNESWRLCPLGGSFLTNANTLDGQHLRLAGSTSLGSGSQRSGLIQSSDDDA